MSDAGRSILFAAVTAVVCSLLLTGAATGLKSYKDRNVALDRQKNILRSVGLVQAGSEYGADVIEEMYREKIDCLSMTPEGELLRNGDKNGILPICFYQESNEPDAYIVTANMKGLWGEIQSYIAIENDGCTVKGFSVSSHSETPGLGGEIEKKWFQQNFEGKRIVDQNQEFVSIRVAKGKATGAMSTSENVVDGISGATLTGRFLTQGLADSLALYEPLSRRFRDNSISIPQGEAEKP